MNRRDFAKLLTTSLIAGSSCKRPELVIENKVKPVSSPQFENIITYKTCFPYYPTPLPIYVDTFEGVPLWFKSKTVNDGLNLQIPPFILASNYILFDKHRNKNPIVEGKETNLNFAFESVLSRIKGSFARNKKVAIITTKQNSHFFNKLCDDLEDAFPLFEISQLPIFDFYNSNLEANISIFHKEVFLQPNFSNKKVIVNFGQDFLNNDPFSPLLVPNFNKKEHILITFEDIISLTGLNSTYRFSLPEDDIFNTALKILALVVETKLGKITTKHFKNPLLDNFSNSLQDDIQKIITHHINDIVFICNPFFSPNLHVITNILNYLCNSYFSKNITNNFWIEDLSWYSKSKQRLKTLLENQTDYELIIFLDYNPYFSLNKKLIEVLEDFGTERLIHLSLYCNELSDKANTFIPLQTYLEFWADRKFLDGTIFFQQKIIEPINKNSISTFDFLFKLRNELLEKKAQGSYFEELLEFYLSFDGNFNIKEAVRNGFKIGGQTQKRFSIENKKINKVGIIEQIKPLGNNKAETTKTLIIPSQNSYAGEYSKNVYLYEMPEPIRGERWSICYFSKKHTNVLNSQFQSDFIVYQNYDYLERFFSINLLNLNPKEINFSYKFFIKENLLSRFTQDFSEHKQIHFESKESIFAPLEKALLNTPKQLYQNTYINRDTQWAMIIDIDRCIGCHLCGLACQIENNIPVVGREYANKNRTMNWVDVVKISNNNQKILFLPIICQHCDNAPCESVCPVGATSHSTDGINEMTYNQCIGSRICMANCPYKVRKFNFEHPEKVHLNYIPEMMNPFVSVRSRGVTEKCTFCIQRVNFERTKAKLFGYEDNFEVRTACEEVCPVGSIKFGRKKFLLNNKKKNELYVLLPEFHTLPNVFYKMNKNEPKNF